MRTFVALLGIAQEDRDTAKNFICTWNEDNMGILVVEFHGVALVDRVLLEAFFQQGEKAVLCVNFNFVVNAF